MLLRRIAGQVEEGFATVDAQMVVEQVVVSETAPVDDPAGRVEHEVFQVFALEGDLAGEKAALGGLRQQMAAVAQEQRLSPRQRHLEQSLGGIPELQIDQQAVVRGVMEDLQALAPFGQFEAAQAVVGQIPEFEPGAGAGDGQALSVEKAQVPHRWTMQEPPIFALGEVFQDRQRRFALRRSWVEGPVEGQAGAGQVVQHPRGVDRKG